MIERVDFLGAGEADNWIVVCVPVEYPDPAT